MKAVESSDRQKFFIDLDSARSESKSSLVEQRARENAQVSNSKIEILDGSNSIDPKKCFCPNTYPPRIVRKAKFRTLEWKKALFSRRWADTTTTTTILIVIIITIMLERREMMERDITG